VQFLTQTVENVKQYLQNFALEATPFDKGGWGDQILNLAFGENYSITAANSILSAWSVGDFSQLPTIEIVSDWLSCTRGDKYGLLKQAS
jgi:hypothetical protein